MENFRMPNVRGTVEIDKMSDAELAMFIVDKAQVIETDRSVSLPLCLVGLGFGGFFSGIVLELALVKLGFGGFYDVVLQHLL
jgi:hypothetical protein